LDGGEIFSGRIRTCFDLDQYEAGLNAAGGVPQRCWTHMSFWRRREAENGKGYYFDGDQDGGERLRLQQRKSAQ
jgi:hypothetical protein